MTVSAMFTGGWMGDPTSVDLPPVEVTAGVEAELTADPQVEAELTADPQVDIPDPGC